MKRGVLKIGLCVVLSVSMALSICIANNKNSKAIASAKNTSTSNQIVQVKKANGIYEYNQPDNIIDDKYRNFYQIMVAQFCDGNGDNIGDLNGITSKLDYLQDLGYNGIWLTPIFESDTNHKYDIENYYNISADFGTVEDFEKLANECEKRNITLILDLVLNHSSMYNDWFIKAISNPTKENKYFNYYNFSKKRKYDKNDNGNFTYHSVNDTYINAINKHLQKESPDTPLLKPLEKDLYVEAYFYEGMPDINLTNPEVRMEFEAITSYWLDKGADGFRLDAALHYINKNKHEANIEVLTWFNNYVKSIKPDAYIVGEVWTNNNTYRKYYKSGVDSFFNFSVAGAGGLITNTALNSKKNIGKKLVNSLIKEANDISSYNQDAISGLFLSNHDMDRTNQYLNNDTDKIKLARGIYQMLSGTTFTYYGEEIGMEGTKNTYWYESDNGIRLGMYWSKNNISEQPYSQANFNQYYISKICHNKYWKHNIFNTCSAPDDTDSNCNWQCVKQLQTIENTLHIGSVEEQQQDPNSILNYTKRILQLKNENPEIARGTMEYLSNIKGNGIMAIKKTYQDSEVIILINTSNENQLVRVPDRYGKLNIRGYATTDDTIVSIDNNDVTLPKNAIVVLK